MNEWIDEWMDKWTNEGLKERMKERTKGQEEKQEINETSQMRWVRRLSWFRDDWARWDEPSLLSDLNHLFIQLRLHAATALLRHPFAEPFSPISLLSATKSTSHVMRSTSSPNPARAEIDHPSVPLAACALGPQLLWHRLSLGDPWGPPYL